MGFYSPATLIQDAKRRGIRMTAPDVVESGWLCNVEADDCVRLGLCYVKGLSQEHVQAMLAERSRAPFRDLRDFLLRTRFSKGERRALASAGALNPLGTDRRGALWAVEDEHDPDSLFAQSLVAEAGGGEVAQDSETSPLPAMSLLERVHADYEQTGFTTGAHPMRLLRGQLDALAVYRASDLPAARNGQWVTIAGSVICRQRPGTAKGFVFISLEDETGISNAICIRACLNASA